jgi:hypothetical protein
VRLQSQRDIPIAINFTSVKRATDLLDEAAACATRRNYDIVQSESGLQFQIENELIPIRLSELMEKVPHTATNKELSRLEAWEKNYALHTKLYGWSSDWDKPKIPEFDLLPSGRFEIEIDSGTRYDGLRRKFKDGKTQKLEGLVEKVITAAATCAAAAIARREEALRRAEELKTRELARKELDRINTLELKRWEYFQSVMDTFNETQRMETLVANYREYFSGHEHLPDCEELLQWALVRTKRAATIADPVTIANTLKTYRLMENDTKLDSWKRIEHQVAQ